MNKKVRSTSAVEGETVRTIERVAAGELTEHQLADRLRATTREGNRAPLHREEGSDVP